MGKWEELLTDLETVKRETGARNASISIRTEDGLIIYVNIMDTKEKNNGEK